MPRNGGKASASHDNAFVDWLQRIGCKKWEGKAILAHYVHRNTDGKWDDMVQHLRTQKVDWWIFIRNQLGKANVSSARARYLDRFCFICGEEPSTPYIDALLGIEECQVEARIGHATTVSCPECKKRDITIAALKGQLKRLGREQGTDEKMELLRQEFERLYVIDPSGHTPRNMVRIDMENFLKRTFGEEETLSATSELWQSFISDVMRIGANGYNGMKCRPRQRSIAHALNLSGPAWNDVSHERSLKRPGEEVS
tara:strand:- start:708 stop:1472 length:765 start_codon:yes stop_codon:yes gene_type:complete